MIGSSNLFFVVLIVITDLVMKSLAVAKKIYFGPVYENPGLPFIADKVTGIFSWVLVLVLFIIFFITYLYYSDVKKFDLAFIFIVGGAVANLIDRAIDNYVTDFITIYNGAYNLADIFIWFGILILLWRMLVKYFLRADD